MTDSALVRAGILRLLTEPLDCDEADSCQCRACRASEAVRPTITERVMRFSVERITEPLVLKYTTASELYRVKEQGRYPHFIAVGEGRVICTTLHDRDRPITTDADCREAELAVKDHRLNAALAAEE